MDKRTMRKIGLLLLVTSIVIYVLQILIFRDARNTFFYIFQDFAFMPVTIAIATIAVGEFINERERRERMEKTKMLTSTFFTEVGAVLMNTMLAIAKNDQELKKLAYEKPEDDEALNDLIARIDAMDTSIEMTAAGYNHCKRLIDEHHTALLVLSSNPLLLEHECFTEMLWSIFHLVDEFRIRGTYENLTPGGVAHMEEDFKIVLKLLMVNWVGNAKYLRETYPNLYRTAAEKISFD